MQKSTLWEHKDGFLYIFCSFSLQIEQEQALAEFFSGRVAVLLLLNHLWQWLGKNTKINIPWQPDSNLPYKVSNPPFRDQLQSLKNTALGRLVCAWYREQAVPYTEKLSTVQRRDQVYTGDQVLKQSYCVVSAMVSGCTQNKQERFPSRSNVGLNTYRGLLESRADMIVLFIIFMYSYIFEHLSRFLCFKCLIHASPTLHPVQEVSAHQLLGSVTPHYNSHLWE